MDSSRGRRKLPELKSFRSIWITPVGKKLLPFKDLRICKIGLNLSGSGIFFNSMKYSYGTCGT